MTGDTLACIEGSRLDLYTLLLGDSTAFTVTLLPVHESITPPPTLHLSRPSSLPLTPSPPLPSLLCLHQNIGVPTNLPLPLSLTPSGSGNILLQSGHTHILLNHKGTVSMASQVSHAVRVDVMGEKGVGLDMLLVYGEGGVVLKCWDEGGRVVEELGGKVEVPENRGIPLQVRMPSLLDWACCNVVLSPPPPPPGDWACCNVVLSPPPPPRRLPLFLSNLMVYVHIGWLCACKTTLLSCCTPAVLPG